MLHTIEARNVQQALPVGIALLQRHGRREDSRNGPVLRYPGPVVTTLTHPCERVIFYDWRDANPFFHLVEAMWMLAGRDDLKQLTPYVKKMAEFSDDGGITQPGAYGKRWRDHFEWSDALGRLGVYDQLDWAVTRLRANPNDRRVIVQMWDAATDIPAADDNGADVPCNIAMMLSVQDGALQMSVVNRSHDIIWGLYGANAVHFSVCQEYLAGRLGLEVGHLTFFSNNFHAYVATLPKFEVADRALYQAGNPYTTVTPMRLFHKLEGRTYDDIEFMMRESLSMLFNSGPTYAFGMARWPFMRDVVAPMARAHQLWKSERGPGRYAATMDALKYVEATDWRRAAEEWIIRRRDKHGE